MQEIDGVDLPVPASNGSGAAQRRIDRAASNTARAGDREVGVDPAITLSLDDLLPDANGDIVIVGADRDCRLDIVTDQRICGSGRAVRHVTADGYDVDGFAFCTFEDGRTLYYAPDLRLSICRPAS